MSRLHDRALFAAFAFAGVLACGGSSDPAAVAVAVSPHARSLAPSGTGQFSATVSGASDQGVTWSVQEGSSGGAVSASGSYTAPAADGTYHVVATSVADPSKSDSATVTVATAAIVVAVSPQAKTLAPGASFQFGATVSNTADQRVTWSVLEGASGGSITTGGTYTAPDAAGTYHVVATSLADGSKSDEATVTVQTGSSGGAWLSISNHRIVDGTGAPFHGRGANLSDTRGCDACTWDGSKTQAQLADEVNRRMDVLVDGWGANFIRLDLESYGAGSGRAYWRGVLDDPDYVAAIQSIVAHASAKGIYVLLALWVDPTFTDGSGGTAAGWPTTATNAEWAKLAEVFKDEPRVLYGLCNEPQANYDGALDAGVWSAMNAASQTIRDVEDAAGTPHHVIVAQGTRSWSRVLDYYVTHPLTAGDGGNFAYETHVYDAATEFAARFETPSQYVPVIIGEFGPASGYMTNADCSSLMQRAEAAGVPYLGWIFHGRCPPNLIVDNSAGGCGVGMTLTPTDWGTLLKNRLAQSW